VFQIEQFSFVDAERDYTALSKRYSKLYVVPEFSKVSNLTLLTLSCMSDMPSRNLARSHMNIRMIRGTSIFWVWILFIECFLLALVRAWSNYG
jgi:hypothetical protein